MGACSGKQPKCDTAADSCSDSQCGCSAMGGTCDCEHPDGGFALATGATSKRAHPALDGSFGSCCAGGGPGPALVFAQEEGSSLKSLHGGDDTRLYRTELERLLLFGGVEEPQQVHTVHDARLGAGIVPLIRDVDMLRKRRASPASVSTKTERKPATGSAASPRKSYPFSDWFIEYTFFVQDNDGHEDEGGFGRSREDGRRFEIPSNGHCSDLFVSPSCLAPEIRSDGRTTLCSNTAIIGFANGRYGFEGCDFSGLMPLSYCFLRENIDIVRWIICMLWGDAAAGSFVNALVNDATLTMWCQTQGLFASECVNSSASGVSAWAGPFQVAFCRVSADATDWRRAFSGTSADRLCAVIHVASTMLHECIHAFGLVLGDVPLFNAGRVFTETDCLQSRKAHVAENTFRWAVLQRRTHAQLSTFCDCIDDTHFGNPVGHGIISC